jgi:serine/threonine protein kinase
MGDLEEKKPKRRDHFQLVKFLGAGRFAATYKAKVLADDLKQEWGEVIAVKIPLSKDFELALLKELVLNAALHMSLQGMKSKNIVKYYGFDIYRDEQDEKHFVMVMEYCDKGNLRGMLGEIGHQEPLGIKESVKIIRQVCEGLKIIHDCKLFHRDISPENILISSEKEGYIVKLADFGVSTILISSELASTVAGKFYYMAPEVFKGEGSFLSDIYSLGVVLYEMTTGRLPFREKTIEALMESIKTKDPPPPRSLNPDIDPVFNDIILKMMHRDYHRRYQSTVELINTLDKYLQGIDPRGDEIDNSLSEIRSIIRDFHYQEAESRLISLLEKFPDNPKLILNLGELYNRCQRYPEAITLLRRGIEKNPGEALLKRDLALALYNSGEKREAIRVLKKALNLGLEKHIEIHAQHLLALWNEQNDAREEEELG